MNLVCEVCLVAAVVGPVTVAGSARLAGGGRPGLDSVVWRTARWLPALMALTVAVSVVLAGPAGVLARTSGGGVAVGLWADPLTATLALLICLVGATVQDFASRYLRNDPDPEGFSVRVACVVTSMGLVATSATALGLVIGWVAAGASFISVVGRRRDLPGVAESGRRARAAFAVGDSALVAALALIWWRAGNVDLIRAGALGRAGHVLGGWGTVVAGLVGLAAASRSAQSVFSRWLPGTVAAPTPVSALLHAGVVNGGGVLLVRFGPLVTDSRLVTVLLLASALLTALVGTAVMRHKADVKGNLVFSTIGQMGFMIAECAVGAYAAAVIHLAGHGVYKAYLFLGSGSGIRRRNSVVPVAVPVSRWIGLGVATLVAAGSGLLADAVAGVHARSTALAVLVALTAGTATWASGRRTGRTLYLMTVACICAASAGYAVVVGVVASWLGPALPVPGAGAQSQWYLLVVAGLGVGVAVGGRAAGPAPRFLGALVDAGDAVAGAEMARPEPSNWADVVFIAPVRRGDMSRVGDAA